MEGIVSRPGDGEFLEGEDRELRVKLSRDELDVLEFEVGPEYEGPGPHFHKEHVDSFYVLEGELEFTIEGNTIRAPAGTYVAAPPGVVHSFTNPGPGHARFLNFHTPDAGFADNLRARNRGEQGGFDSIDAAPGTGPPATDAVFLGPGGGERLEGTTRVATIKIAREEICLVEFELEPGFEGPDPHAHDDHIDSFYVLEGEPQFLLGDETVRLGPGAFVAAPLGFTHTFANPGPERARLLNIHAPSTGFHDFLRRVS